MAKSTTRKRNVSTKKKIAQKKDEDESKQAHETAPSNGSSGVVIILVIMVSITWGIAATSYFGVVDYKSLLSKMSYNSENKGEVVITDKRRPVISPTAPARKTIKIIDLDSDFGDEPLDVEIKSNVNEKPIEPLATEDKSNENKVKEVKIEPPKPKSPETKPPADKKEKQDTATEKKTTPKDTEDTPVKSQDPAKKKPAKPAAVDTWLSDADKPIMAKIKEGEKLLANKKANQAKQIFTKLTKSHPDSPRALFGLAHAEEILADVEKSNMKLTRSCENYVKAAEMDDCPDELIKEALNRATEKYRFLGKHRESLMAIRSLAQQFPEDIDILNKLGLAYLYGGMNKQGLKVFERSLSLDPDDGYALVHKGFILKVGGDWEASIPVLSKGIKSNHPGTQEGKFYFHLGDAYHRTGHPQKATDIYALGAKRGLFLSQYQRSLYNVDRLKGQPFWTPEEAGTSEYVRRLQLNWKLIKKEALSMLDQETGLFKHEEESLKDTGEWRQFTLFQQGRKIQANCQNVPKTCGIIERMPNAAGCKRGQVKFSVMMPGTHVWPHTGPTNCRLRMHLGLVVPTTGEGSRLICANQTRHWQEGKVLIFDDSFEHEVYQNAESYRLILIVDVWHPELTEQEKKTLTPI